MAKAAIAAGELCCVSLTLLFNTWLGLVHHYLVNRDLFFPEGSVLEARGEELLSHFMMLIRKD
ncbi:MAG: hypothetical protein HN348_22320 [Proteobacteria bacterium]|nr:hypothetical protein [Pseudomonadota bacterium]